MSVTSVEKHALSYKRKCSPMARLCARISGASVYFFFGM